MNKKALMEKRAELQARMDELVNTAETENRALSEEEVSEFDAAEAEIRAIDETLSRADKARNLQPVRAGSNETAEQMEERAFVDYVMGRVTELRSGEQNVDWSNNNGAIIPTSISNRIVTKDKEV